MLNTFEETFEVTEMRTFKHEPFFTVGSGGGGGGGGRGELIRGTFTVFNKVACILYDTFYYCDHFCICIANVLRMTL